MRLAELVATSEAVAGTSSRTAKIESLATLLRRLDPDEVGVAVCLLSGEPRQGKIGIGWSTVSGLRVRPATEPSLTIAALDDALAELQTTTGPGSGELRTRILTNLLSKATGGEQDFMRRLLVGELRQGALEGVMAEAIARAAGVPAAEVRRALMFCGDLSRTAREAVVGGTRGLQSIGLTVLHPVLPMLAGTAPDVGEALAQTGRASVEWKLDGIRIQVHKLGDDVRVYTRNLNDITLRVPEVVEVARAVSGGTIVLDGEAILLDEARRPHAFQDTMSRMGRHRADADLLAVAWFFDCLHVDGVDLTDLPLHQRLGALDRVAGAWRIPGVVTDEERAAAAVLDDALAAGHEGVMVKSIDSPYQAGRRGKAWRKVKPVKTLDLVVLGAEWGHGRRRGWLSNLHLGARDPAGGFVMVGKTFKGLTDELLAWQTTALLERETARDGITVFVRPDLVVEVALDGAQVSPRYPGGVALRFARVKRYRPDKRPEDTDTIGAVRGLLARPD